MKALFKINADKWTVTRAIEVAIETEDAAKVAKETVFGSIPERVYKVKSFWQTRKKFATSSSIEKDKGKFYRCGQAGHLVIVIFIGHCYFICHCYFILLFIGHCYFKNATCNYCKLQGHLNLFAGKEKQNVNKNGKFISVCNASYNFCRVTKLQISVYINSQQVCMELDTATGGNFLSQKVLNKLGKPDLQQSSLQFQSASKHLLLVLGTFVAQTTLTFKGDRLPILYTATNISNLNFLGRDAIATLNISIDKILFCSSSTSMNVKS